MKRHFNTLNDEVTEKTKLWGGEDGEGLAFCLLHVIIQELNVNAMRERERDVECMKRVQEINS